MGKIMGYLKQLSTEMVSYSSEYKVTSNPKSTYTLTNYLSNDIRIHNGTAQQGAVL